MEGLLGLTKSINDRDAAVRDLSVLERMDARIQSDRTAEVQAQQQEQMFYERMYASADQLLEKDRMKINKKVLMAQKQVREHLDLSGGSRRRFMENGGVSVLNEISNSIIRSDEAVVYGENKKNLAKILEAKEKNLGHLLTPRDLKSLEDYDSNPEGGRITYSGIMSEVEIPPSANFDYSSDIPIEKILSHGSNAMKIRQNYAINYPDRPEPNYLELVAFAKKMGYGGTGSNTIKLREKMLAQRQRSRYNKQTTTKKDPKKISYLNELNVLKQKIDTGLNVDTINKPIEEGGYGGNMIEALKAKNPSFNKLLGDKFTAISRQRNLSEKGIDITDFQVLGPGSDGKSANLLERLFNEKVGLKEAYSILPHNTFDIAERIFGEEGEKFKIENGQIVDFLPTEDMYRMDGVKITKDNKLDPDDHKGNYKVVGLSTALKSKMASDGTDALLINAYNDDGSLDKDSTLKIDKGYTSEAKLTTVIALENESGDLFYKEIDLSQPQIKTLMSNKLDADDDLTDTVAQENQSAALIENISRNTREEQIQFQGAINTMNEQVFEDPIFKGEGERYWGEHSGGQENRYPLMKSFYMAFDFINNSYKRDQNFPQGDRSVRPNTTKKLIDNEMFTTSAIAGDIEEDLKSYNQGNDERNIIAKWLKNVNSDMEEGSLGHRKNQELASKWMQLLSMM